MIIEKIGIRGTVFTFQEGDSAFSQDTSVYLIDAGEKLFLCDTHVGPKSMEVVKEHIDTQGLREKEIIVFNSHSDWDHIWGNCAFPDSTIIAHESCRQRIEERGEYDLEKYEGKFHDGTFKLKLPNLTFDNRLKFEEHDIEFIYAPGHTVDSAICYDRKDSVLFVGDLVEYPNPYLNYDDLGAYIKSLEYIKSLGAKIILCGHSGKVDENLINENIAFITELTRPKTSMDSANIQRGVESPSE